MGVVRSSAPRKTLTLALTSDGEDEEKSSIENQKQQQKKKKETEREGGIFASCSFSDLGIHPTLSEQLRERLGFEVPTLIQAESIPIIISGRHVYPFRSFPDLSMQLLVLARLLRISLQLSIICSCMFLVSNDLMEHLVYEILQKLLHRFHWIVPGYIMGGENRSKEKARLRKGISILVATPGRLLDHLKNTSSFAYANLRWIIFDEADRILELGFGKEIEGILILLGSRQSESVGVEAVPRPTEFQRQNLLLSATLNDKVNHLAKMSLENPVMIGLDDKKISAELPTPSGEYLGTIASDGNGESIYSDALPSCSVEDYNLPVQLVQRYVKVSCGSRLVVLLSILRSLFEREVHQKIVVFFSTCDAVDFHYSLIGEFQWSSDSQPEVKQKQTFVKCRTFRLHGNMEHDDRRTTFQVFNAEKSALLLCTDVAARGLDFPKVRCIIQYDSPGEATEYVHRVGRTARLGEKGDALLFLQPVETDYLQDLQKHRVSLKEFPLLKVFDSFSLYDQKHHNKKLLSLEMHPWVLSLQKALESFISSEMKLKNLAKKAFRSWVRAYTAHRGELKRIFVVKKLHLGHVARSFGLKEQPSLVGRSFHTQKKKRKRDHRPTGSLKRKRAAK
ncbi:DEAD-box ATP-dependent RNA helicase 17 isoform X2 [Magnolia sinica]|uniref:DEAD-box ATP-dependent RNA helicase 17 isoform X2 n=1 Tax=Magnolia sinica TaxID=86752 RepID=UPI00265B63C7|nr:DEAD-box ATP-dependent RNA helicase 17 isoform X2 [Magnolia sinica]